MSFELRDTSVVLDGNDFDAVAEVNTGKHYFAERVNVVGILNFGKVSEGKEEQISLADNDINSPIIIDSIIAIPDDNIRDEILFTLYRNTEKNLQIIGTHRFFNRDMPLDYPDGIVYPDMILGVKPLRSDAIIIVYVKPVKILFEAVSNSQLVTSKSST